ncbi:MAG: glycoside hydrolase family 43 protein [Pirellulales bacterium]|nr:glycoside hydrolase family 43 protein [Pirellulales bacterium]
MRYFRVLLIVLILVAPRQVIAKPPANDEKVFTAYLMAYFGPEEKLFYAFSRDARHWTSLNAGQPVFDAHVRLRDPFVSRVLGKFHLVHTKGWDHPAIFHWESKDLIRWTGGEIQVVDESRKRAWAPELFYVADDGLFYVFWASIYDDHNTIHYVTTRDWNDITPARSTIYYDLGIHDIDLTIVQHAGTYYGFHKPGDVQGKMGNRLLTATNLDPQKDTFGGKGVGRDVFPDSTRPTEGPEVIKVIGQDKWYVYADPFHSALEAWETTDFDTFKKIAVSTPAGAKHGSMIPITERELETLLKTYPGKSE